MMKRSICGLLIFLLFLLPSCAAKDVPLAEEPLSAAETPLLVAELPPLEAEVPITDIEIIYIKKVEYSTKLTELDLSGLDLFNEDITPLRYMKNLTDLYLNDNQISDLAPLSGLSKLHWLDLSNNLVSDLTPLSGLPYLSVLLLSENQIQNLMPLSNLINLRILDLHNNEISDLTHLSDLMSLTNLDIRDNLINDWSPVSHVYRVSGKPAPDLPDLTAGVPFWKKVDGSTATIPLTEAIYKYFEGDGGPPEHTTTRNAYSRLVGGDADLIFATYPSPDNFDYARSRGVELEIIPVVKDALVFLVNIENPVDNIQLPQISDVYTGKIKNWKEIGGFDEEITPYQRPANSGSQTLFLKMAMNDQSPMDPPVDWVITEMVGLVDIVSGYDNSRDAIGYSMFYYVNNMYGNSRFKLLNINGINPSRDTITRSEYCLEDFYYAVMRKNTPEESPARKLVTWLLSEEGQTCAVQAGYIPLQPMENVWPDISIDPVFLGDHENSAGTGGTVFKGWEAKGELLIAGVRTPLSDVFYDGFNYIDYINNDIMRYYLGNDGYWNPVSLDEEYLKRSFSGIPNDYPNYELRNEGYITIHIPKGNPYFTDAKSINVRLTPEISPYGVVSDGLSVDYYLATRLTPKADLFALHVRIPQTPDVESRINEQLNAWISSFPERNDKLVLIEYYMSPFENYIYKLEPSYHYWNNYLSICYKLWTEPDELYMAPMLFAICFDMDTGEQINLAEKLPESIYKNEYQAFLPILYLEDWPDYGDDGISNDQYFIPNGSVITEAWFDYYSFEMYVTEPDGRILQTVLPLKIWQSLLSELLNQ